MPHILDIVYGSTTIHLASGACRLLNYVPRTPTSLDEDATVAEPCKIEIGGVTIADVQSALRTIELAFRQAERYAEYGLGDRVYVEFLPDGDIYTYRSELMTGKPDLDSNTLDDRWVERKIDVTLNWTRRFCWEGPEITLPLTNGHGTGTTLQVDNSSDSGHDNFVEIAAEAVLGDLPAPAKITIAGNAASVNAQTTRLWLRHNLDAVSGDGHIIEAESRTYVAGGAAATAGSYSGGYAQVATWAASTETVILKFTLPAALLAAYPGHWVNLLVRCKPAASGYWLRSELVYTPGATPIAVASGPRVLLDSAEFFQDIGLIRFPEKVPGTYIPLELYIYALKSGGGSLTIDFLQATEAENGARWLKPQLVEGGIRSTDTLIDAPGEHLRPYLGYSMGLYQAVGSPIYLKPNSPAQRVYLLTTQYAPSTVTYSYSEVWHNDVSVAYRPRRVTL